MTSAATANDFHDDSKRGHERLIAYWQHLAKGRKFPEETDIDTDAIADLWNSCFLLNTQKDSGSEFKYEFMGPSLIEAYGVDLTGQAHTENTEPNIASILNSFKKVVDVGEHVVDESEFTNKQQQLVKYRCCLVPFGNAPSTVKYILGFMRWKYE
jgi:hypothetical protein